MVKRRASNRLQAEILRFVSHEEPLTATLSAFPGIDRAQLKRMLDAAAERLLGEIPAEAPITAMTRLRMYCDGAARGNPGLAGAGAVLVEPSGQVVDRLGKFLGSKTNNYAEYSGLLLGLARATELGVSEIEVFADSELMIRQLGGRYQVRSASLRPLYEQALRLINEFERVKLVHVPREMNRAADEMSNRAIDERMEQGALK
jgi:ribonuclease HI